jgi:hypothetical protein
MRLSVIRFDGLRPASGSFCVPKPAVYRGTDKPSNRQTVKLFNRQTVKPFNA